jgi:hypothetical protein
MEKGLEAIGVLATIAIVLLLVTIATGVRQRHIGLEGQGVAG